MSEAIRVLHVFAALDSGGVSNFVMNVYRRIDREKVQFDFALTSGKPGMFDEEARRLGARTFYFDKDKKLIDELDGILRQRGPFATVHSHVFFYSGLILRSARLAGVGCRIAHAHNAHTGEGGSILRKAYEGAMRRMIRANATVLLGCSEKACRYVFGESIMNDARCRVLSDGIDCERFAFCESRRESVRAEYGLSDSFTIGHVGHFNPAKNHEKILGVFAQVCKTRPDAALMLVGDGELEADVRARAAALGVAERVVFTGALPDVENAYQAMDVFIFPSRYEGFGMAMIEAQASGLACVASDVVPEETNAAGRAVYLPLEADDTAWAEAVLAAPARERDGSSALRVKETYDIDIVAEKLCDIYIYEGL